MYAPGTFMLNSFCTILRFPFEFNDCAKLRKAIKCYLIPQRCLFRLTRFNKGGHNVRHECVFVVEMITDPSACIMDERCLYTPCVVTCHHMEITINQHLVDETI